MLPVIAVNSQRPGLLLVNGVSAGDVGPDTYISLPVAADGRCYLHFLPAQNGVQACALRLDAREGSLHINEEWDIPAMLIRWPSQVHEITFYPLHPQPVIAAPLSPEIVTTTALGDHCEAALVSYGGLWVLVEHDERTVLSHPLPPQATSGQLQAVPGGFAAWGPQWGALFTGEGDQWRPAGCETGDAVQLEADGSLRIETRLEDAAGHVRVSTLRPGGGKGHAVYTQGQAALRSHADLAQAFLQACALEEYREATGYLSSGLRRQISGEALREFLGPVSTCSTARYSPAPAAGETALAALIRESEHVMQALPLAFTFVTEGDTPRIDDIRAL